MALLILRHTPEQDTEELHRLEIENVELFEGQITFYGQPDPEGRVTYIVLEPELVAKVRGL